MKTMMLDTCCWMLDNRRTKQPTNV